MVRMVRSLADRTFQLCAGREGVEDDRVVGVGHAVAEQDAVRVRNDGPARRGEERCRPVLIKEWSEYWIEFSPQTSRGSFSAVSTPIFASKYSLESSWRDLQDSHTFAPLRCFLCRML